MASLRVLALALLMGASVLAQSQYGVGRTPTAEEIRAWDISIGPTGEELPPGEGHGQRGRAAVSLEGLRGMPRRVAIDGKAPMLKSKAARESLTSGREDESCRFARRSRRRCGITSIAAMPLNREGTLDRR